MIPSGATTSRPTADGSEEVHEVFLDSAVTASAGHDPDGLAVVDGPVRLSYAELADAVDRCAGGLRSLGVAPRDVVSWQLPNWHEAVVLHHAVLRLGAVSNPIVPIYRQREVGFVLGAARSRVVVLPASFRGFDHAAMLDELRPGLPDLQHVVTVRGGGRTPTFADLVASDPLGLPEPARTPQDPVLLMFTSGTTARPKGVQHTHETLGRENRSIARVYRLGADDVVFMPSPLAHITGLLYGITLPPMLGVPVVLQDVWDPIAALGSIRAEGCSFTLAATPFLYGLTHHPDLGPDGLPSMRVFACGGADVPPALIRDADRLLGGCRATRVYGSTEFPTLSTSPPEAPLERRADTDGAAIAPAEYRLVDDGDAPVATGQVGHLLVRGPEMFVGYLRPEDGDGAFAADGWFRTGDLATSDDEGYLTIRGRSKDIIVRGGENISVTEVEQLLYEHPDVREVAIVAMPDPVLVERACAFVVPEDGRRPDLAELTAFLATKQLARQKLPERLELVDALPKTLSGKVQKFVLRDAVRRTLADLATADGAGT